MKAQAFLLGAALLVSLPSVLTAKENGITLVISPGTGPGELLLSWSGGQPTFLIYRADTPRSVITPATLVGQSDLPNWTDAAGPLAPGGILFYEIDSPCQYNPPEICDGLDNDCDGTVDNPGSETSCNLPNATPACVAGACVVSSCASGFADCDGSNADGCEASLSAPQTNSPDKFGGHDVVTGYLRVAAITNCGGCGVSCDDGNPCTTDLCVPAGSTGQCRHYNRAMCAGARCTSATFVVTSGEGQGDPGCAGPDSDSILVGGTSRPAPDGLPDAWETPQQNPYTGASNPKGVDIDCDGVIDGSTPGGADVELPDSDPNRPDLYVSYDYMPASGSELSHRPMEAFLDSGPGSNNTGALVPGAIDRVVSAFASKGIALHMGLNVNASGVVTSTDHVRMTLTPHREVVTFCPDTSFAGTSDAVTFDQLKAANFDQRKRFTHKYAVFGHFVQCNGSVGADCPPCTSDFCGPTRFQSSGMAELTGNDMIITLGGPVYVIDPNTTVGKDTLIRMQAGTIAHEIGHTIGLNHGGATPTTGDVCTSTPEQDRLNHKPNFISVMNFRYQFTGIGTSSDSGSSNAAPAPYSGSPFEGDPNFIPLTRVDYSPMALNPLDENALNEFAGVSDCAVTGLRDIIKFNGTWFDPATGMLHDTAQILTGPGCGPVDWNGNFFDTLDYENPVMVDTNRHGFDPIFFNPELAGFDDWSFVFGHLPFQCSPNFGDAASTGQTRTFPPDGD